MPAHHGVSVTNNNGSMHKMQLTGERSANTIYYATPAPRRYAPDRPFGHQKTYTKRLIVQL